MMQLTDHFSLEELIASETAARKHIDNMPPVELMPNLRVLAQGLEQVRAALGGRPIHINSGYRSLALNKEIGGAEKSKHMFGLAADILCPQFGTPLDVCRAIVVAKIPVDQVIHEFGKWCHVSFAAPGEEARGELLTIASAAKGYETGLNPVV
ncbi:MAG: D-Ala-D-Ala carboxypeptidase family metallohydrolase [Burkholderiales bacterium]